MKKTILIFFLTCALIGCGVKGDPVPPRSSVPQPIENLQVFSRDGQLVLQWSVPKKDTDGMEVAGLSGFRVWRREVLPSDDECPTCPKKFDSIADIDFLSLPAAQKKQRVLTFWDDEDKKDVRYGYAVTSYTVQGRESDKSNSVTITWMNPPSAPGCVKGHPGDRTVALTWNCDESAAPSHEFNVYRRSGSEAYPINPINAEPIRASEYRDLAVSNGETYRYVVRALQKSDDILIEGKSSSEAMVKPEDRTPPTPPTISMAFQGEEGIVVVWEPSSEADVAGYYVYRRMVGTDTPVKVSPLIKAAPRFVDTAFTPGRVYYYSVTAADQAPQENVSDFSQELRVETKRK